MPAITITDLSNAKLDTDHIAAYTTGTANTTTDRLGNVKNTITGNNAVEAAARALRDSTEATAKALRGYEVPVAYATAISLTRATQTVSYLGAVYAANLATLPFTTSGTFETTNFRVIQGGDSSLVVYDGGNVQTVLDDAKPMANYTALRAYTGRATGVRITAQNLAGNFQRDVTDTTSADNGVTVLIDASGRRWKRLYSGLVNFKWCGAVGNGIADDTAAQVMANASGIKTFYIPSGSYVMSEFRLKSEMGWIGESERGTVITSKAGTATPLVTINAGPVTSVNIDGISFDGTAGAAGQIGWYLYAQPQASAPFDGGVWNSHFRRINISGFTGHGIYMRGGPTNFVLPNQFNTFEGVNVFRANNTTARCLLMTGQNAQNTFLNCELDGKVIGVGTNIELSRQFANGSAVGGFTMGGTADGDNAPSTNRFLLVTTQNSEYGYQIDRASDNVIDQPWFENLYRSVRITTASTGTHINKGHFANAASDGSGGGYGVKVEGGCKAAGDGNAFLGATDKTFVGSNHQGMNFTNTSTLADGQNLTSGLTRQLADASGVVTTFSLTDVLLNATTNNIITITSSLMANDVLKIRAGGSYVKFASGGNILLPGGKTILLRSGDSVVFKRDDLYNGWFPEAVYVARLAAGAMPTTGYYEAGEIVWNSSPSISTGKVLLGWLRLVTGTAHVANTDWSACYVTNA